MPEVNESEKVRKRREEAAMLRRAARSTTPRAYQTRRVERPATFDHDPTIDAQETYTNLFGAFTSGTHWREHVANAMVLGAQLFAYLLLVLVLNIAQCSWWYERGMYSDPDRIQTPGR